MWQALTGPREYLLVSYHTKWSEMDVIRDPKMTEHAGDVMGIVARLSAATESSTREIHLMQPDLTLPRPAETPKLVRVARLTVASGKVDEVLDALNTMTLPAMKKSGITTYGVERVRYGSGTNQLMAHTGFNSWADLDGPSPVEKALGADGYQKYVTKMAILTTRTEWNVYRFMPELSYVVAAK